MRLFFAVNFPENVKSELLQSISALRSSCVSGNFTRSGNLHLTLAFLGETEPRRVPELRSIMDSVESEPFSLAFELFGSFGRPDDALFWRGARPSPALTLLDKRLKNALAAADFYFDSKPLKPHITLARRCLPAHGFNAAAFGRSLPPFSAFVDGFSLMHSERPDGKLTYTEIYKRSFILRKDTV